MFQSYSNTSKYYLSDYVTTAVVIFSEGNEGVLSATYMLCNEVTKLQIRSNKIVKNVFIAKKKLDLKLGMEVVQCAISIFIFVQAEYQEMIEKKILKVREKSVNLRLM